jgi:biopolymer transport protein ExbD
MKLQIKPFSDDDGVPIGSLASMIDIIFLLIIFFVVTASFDNAQMDQEVMLPQISGHTPIKSLPPDRLIINVRQNGEVRVGFISIPSDKLQVQLKHVLRKHIASRKTTIIINGDGRTKHKYIAEVMNILGGLGYSNVQMNAAIESTGG